MLSKEDIQLYYDQWVNIILKLYIKNFGVVKWCAPEKLFIKNSKNRISWEDKISDKFIIESKNDRAKIGHDILIRGMYWPFFTIDNYVLLGIHRLESLWLTKTTKEFLCIELNKNHIGDSYNTIIDSSLKYDNNIPLEHSFWLDIPTPFEKPIDARDKFDYLILNNNKKANNKFTSIEIKTYRDLMDILRITPHWIKNYLYDYNINPNVIINSKEEFNKWISV